MAKVTLNPQNKTKGITFVSSKSRNYSLMINVILVIIIAIILVVK